ncbi:MAG: sigma-70 family RNA polymerase sigma factor [Cyanobacteriota bacterium]|nr:sigma-70 family RNA polymerase sigma factor [Cyanobacteriota bacterium]
MNELDLKLRRLIASACKYPAQSLERQQFLAEVYLLVMKSGKLWKEHVSYYNDALQEMWEYCCQHPEEYNPDIKGPIVWLDDELKKRLRRMRDGKYRQQRRFFIVKQTEQGVTNNPIDDILASPEIQPALEIWERTILWVQQDPDKRLRNVYFRKRPEINAQVLILKRLPPNTPSWKEIAAEFNLNPQEAKDLPKFYNRKCLPLLREFGLSQGYIEESATVINSNKHT